MAIEIRKRIRAVRQAKGFTTVEIARQAGISRPYYSQLEGGKRRLSVPHLEKIAAALGVSVSKLYQDEPLEEGRKTRKGSRSLRPVNTPELREKLEPLLGKQTADFIDCYQVWVQSPETFKRKLRGKGGASRNSI